MADIVMRTRDCPDANGRTPDAGEQRWTLRFPLESGDTLLLLVGASSHRSLIEMLQNEAADNEFVRNGGYHTS